LIVVLTYVIPAIKPLFDNSDVELPVATKALIFTSDFIVNNVGLLFLLLATLFVLFV
jgi:type IV pilus assembly protein PilC